MSEPSDVTTNLMRRSSPHVIVLFGATGDLAKRKLLPGLLHLHRAGLLPACRIVGTSLDDLDDDGFRNLAEQACDEFASRTVTPDGDGRRSPPRCTSCRTADGAAGAAPPRSRRPRTSSATTPAACTTSACRPARRSAVVQMLAEADLVDRSRIIMEKPFGTDLRSARRLNAPLHETFDESQIFRIDHFLGKEAAQNILAFRFANGLFEPIWNRNHIDHVQIDVPETLALDQRDRVLRVDRRLPRHGRHPPVPGAGVHGDGAADRAGPEAISEEKNKVFRSMLPIEPADVVRGQYTGYRDEPGVSHDSETETFIALRCEIDNWRWAGVPFFLRTGKRMAEGARIISIAFREPPKSMFPPGSGVGAHGPDHLTFDLADASKLSLSFYGKRPGPGMKLDKLSLQFALHETGKAGDVLEAYERLIHDAMSGDHTLFTTAEGIERLWELSTPLLDSRRRCGRTPPGSWGPNAIHQLIAPARLAAAVRAGLARQPLAVAGRHDGDLDQPLGPHERRHGHERRCDEVTGTRRVTRRHHGRHVVADDDVGRDRHHVGDRHLGLGEDGGDVRPHHGGLGADVGRDGAVGGDRDLPADVQQPGRRLAQHGVGVAGSGRGDRGGRHDAVHVRHPPATAPCEPSESASERTRPLS